MTDAPTYLSILDDLPTGADNLGFQPYIDALADILLDPNTRTPLTLSLSCSGWRSALAGPTTCPPRPNGKKPPAARMAASGPGQ